MNPETCDVTVVIPVYNGAHLLPGCIESVFGQTVPPREIIVVDDGSSDNVQEVAARYGSAVRFICQNNGGSGAARNTGVQIARCRWIALLDQDDRWLPRKLELQLACAASYPSAALIYCDALLSGPYRPKSGTFLEGRTPFQGWVFDQLLEWCFVLPSMSMVRKDALLEVGGFNSKLRGVDDYDLWLRLARKYEFRAVADPLVLYERQEKSYSHCYAAMARAEIQLLRNLLETELSATQRQKARRRLARRFFELGYEIRKSNPQESMYASWSAARLQPLSPGNWILVLKSMGWAVPHLSRFGAQS